jgi:WD40 repeat protein
VVAGDCDANTMRAVQRQIIQWTPQVNSVTLEGHSDGVTCLGHSVEHKKLLSGALDRTIRVWDLTLHEPLCQAELRGHRGGVTGLAVSTSKLVSGSADMTLKVFILA